MKSIVDYIDSAPLLTDLDKARVSIRTIKCLKRGALRDLADSSLDGEDFDLVVDAFVSRGLL